MERAREMLLGMDEEQEITAILPCSLRGTDAPNVSDPGCSGALDSAP